MNEPKAPKSVDGWQLAVDPGDKRLELTAELGSIKNTRGSVEHHKKPVSGTLTDDDFAYDLLWRETFKQPLPMLGGGDTVRQILTRAGLSPSRITAALAKARDRTDRPPE